MAGMDAATLLVMVQSLSDRILAMEQRQDERLYAMEFQRCGMCLHHVERMAFKINELQRRLEIRIEALEARVEAIVLRIESMNR